VVFTSQNLALGGPICSGPCTSFTYQSKPRSQAPSSITDLIRDQIFGSEGPGYCKRRIPDCTYQFSNFDMCKETTSQAISYYVKACVYVARSGELWTLRFTPNAKIWWLRVDGVVVSPALVGGQEYVYSFVPYLGQHTIEIFAYASSDGQTTLLFRKTGSALLGFDTYSIRQQYTGAVFTQGIVYSIY
jgi:hypothetical protein